MKSIFKSKTMWLNLITGILSVVALINPELLGAFGLTAEQQHKILTGVGFLVAVLNMILRMNTTQPVGIKPTEDAQPK